MAELATRGPSPQPSSFDAVQVVPNGALKGIVTCMTGYRERARGWFRQREAAALVIPLIISFDEPFQIALGRDPTPADRVGSFAAGLFSGPVTIDSFGAAHCLQIDFSPLGARRFFQRPLSELTGSMVELSDVLGASGLRLRERLGNEDRWSNRFDIVGKFVEQRVGRSTAPCARVGRAFGLIAASGGRATAASIAREIGWSRKHLASRFCDEIGLGPKAIGRIVRFRQAQAFGRIRADRWADIAADCGYADQSHLTREFAALAGESPNAWQARLASAGNIPSRPVGDAVA